MKTIQKVIFAVAAILVGSTANGQDIHHWTETYNNINNGTDYGVSIATHDCYVYVTGASEGIGSGMDYLTIKYDLNGDTVWTRRYDGPASGDDIPAKILVDDDGSVYVTGKSEGEGTDFDFATLKYDENGNPEWEERFNNDGPDGDGEDAATDMVLDNLGNVYVTGYGTNMAGPVSNEDYLTIRYDSNGDFNWSTYDILSAGANENNDRVWAIAYHSGKVYVTGQSLGSGYYASYQRHYLTFGYDAGTGDWVWAGNFPVISGTNNRIGTAIDTDGAGNVYVTGYANGAIVTEKIASDGGQQNLVTYSDVYEEAANDIEVDGSNVYITGYRTIEGGTKDVLTIKYDDNLQQVWMQSPTYNGEAYYVDDEGIQLIVDDDQVYVLGYSTLSNGDIETRLFKYEDNGATWQEDPVVVLGCNGDQMPAAFALDNSNNLYITGYTECGGTQEDYFTTKYISFIPIANAGADVMACENVGAQIGANSTAGFTYSWSPTSGLSSSTASNPNAEPNADTEYVLTVTAGCVQDSDIVFVGFLSAPVTPNIVENDGVLWCSAEDEYTYQWYLDGDILNDETNQSITPTVGGEYTCMVTGENGCSALSEIWNWTSIDELTSTELMVYPNPSNGLITVSSPTPFQGNNTLTIRDMHGCLIVDVPLVTKTSTFDFDLAAGLYQVEVSGLNHYVGHLVVIR